MIFLYTNVLISKKFTFILLFLLEQSLKMKYENFNNIYKNMINTHELGKLQIWYTQITEIQILEFLKNLNLKILTKNA